MTTPDKARQSDRTLARIGAIAFLLLGVLHAAGSGLVLAELASGGPAAGFGVYGTPETVNAQIAGSVLGYMSYLILAAGLAVACIAARMNWRNSELGLALNTGLVLLIEAGLAVFLLVPGHISLAEAGPGIGLFLIAAVFSGVACQKGAHHAS